MWKRITNKKSMIYGSNHDLRPVYYYQFYQYQGLKFFKYRSTLYLKFFLSLYSFINSTYFLLMSYKILFQCLFNQISTSLVTPSIPPWGIFHRSPDSELPLLIDPFLFLLLVKSVSFSCSVSGTSPHLFLTLYSPCLTVVYFWDLWSTPSRIIGYQASNLQYKLSSCDFSKRFQGGKSVFLTQSNLRPQQFFYDPD